MIQVPSAAEHCKQLDDIHGMSQDVIDSHVEFAKLHRDAILESAASKAVLSHKLSHDHLSNKAGFHFVATKESILNSYPVELIK